MCRFRSFSFSGKFSWFIVLIVISVPLFCFSSIKLICVIQILIILYLSFITYSLTLSLFLSFSFFWLFCCLSSMNLRQFSFDFFLPWASCNVFSILEIILSFSFVSFLRSVNYFFFPFIYFSPWCLDFEFLIKGVFYIIRFLFECI